MFSLIMLVSFFFLFFNDTATTEIYTLSLHDALPISPGQDHIDPGTDADHSEDGASFDRRAGPDVGVDPGAAVDRKSTRLNSSHSQISYAVFCLKKKKQT